MKMEDFLNSLASARARAEMPSQLIQELRHDVVSLNGSEICWLANRMDPYQDATDAEVDAAWTEISVRSKLAREPQEVSCNAGKLRSQGGS